MYSALLRHLADDWPELISKRLDCLVPQFGQEAALSVKVLKANLGPFQSHVKMCTIKTLTNAWATSYRYHERILLPCIFGCRKCDYSTLSFVESPFDTTAHYLRCPILACIVGRTLKWETPPNPVEWLGVAPFPDANVIGTAIAFAVYHACKLSHREKIAEAMERDLGILPRPRAGGVVVFRGGPPPWPLVARFPFNVPFPNNFSRIHSVAMAVAKCTAMEYVNLSNLQFSEQMRIDLRIGASFVDDPNFMAPHCCQEHTLLGIAPPSAGDMLT